MTGVELKAIRAQTGLSQAGFADLVRADARRIRRYETGERDIPPYSELLFLLIKDHGAEILEPYR